MNQPLPLAQWLSTTRPDDTPVAWFGEQTWTLGQLRYDVSRVVNALQQQDGERWALCFENSYLFIVALLATLSAGKTPVVPGHNRISLLEEQSGLFNGVLSDKTFGWKGALLVVNSAKTRQLPISSLPTISGNQNIELFTSGSTGQPKRVKKSIASLDEETRLLSACFGERLEGCRVVSSVVFHHLYGLTFRIFLPMSLGLTLHATMIYYAEQLSALPRQHMYVFVSSPAFLKRLDSQLTPPPLTLVLSAGGMLPWKNVLSTQSWLDLWPDEIYGSTETGILAWRHRVQDNASWIPFPGIDIAPHGDAFRVISPMIDEKSGLLIDDILHFEENGQFHLRGRRGRVVKIEEKRISLSEIERRLMALNGIIDAAALPVSRGGRQCIGVLLVLDNTLRQTWRNNNGEALELSWRRALIPWLEPVAIPRYWRVIDEIPVNTMNKRVYAQLQELFYETP